MMSLILENGRATLRLSSLYCCCAREKEVCEEMACREGGVKRGVCVCVGGGGGGGGEGALLLTLMYLLISIFLLRYQPTMKAVSRPVKQLQVEKQKRRVQILDVLVFARHMHLTRHIT